MYPQRIRDEIVTGCRLDLKVQFDLIEPIWVPRWVGLDKVFQYTMRPAPRACPLARPWVPV